MSSSYLTQWDIAQHLWGWHINKRVHNQRREFWKILTREAEIDEGTPMRCSPMTMQVLIDSAWIVDCPLGESWYVIDDGALEEEGRTSVWGERANVYLHVTIGDWKLLRFHVQSCWWHFLSTSRALSCDAMVLWLAWSVFLASVFYNVFGANRHDNKQSSDALTTIFMSAMDSFGLSKWCNWSN